MIIKKLYHVVTTRFGFNLYPISSIDQNLKPRVLSSVSVSCRLLLFGSIICHSIFALEFIPRVCAIVFWETLLLIIIIISFFGYLFNSPSISLIYQYIKDLLIFYCFYILNTVFSFLFIRMEICYTYNYYFAHITIFTWIIKLVIAVFALIIFSLLLLNLIPTALFVLELPLFLGILFIVFLYTIDNFHLFLLFILIELVTVLLVLSISSYYSQFGAHLLKPAIQFFILNSIIMSFYLLALSFMLVAFNSFDIRNLTYITPLIAYFNRNFQTGLYFDAFIHIIKLVFIFAALPFLFKLTLAPFSIWIINVYTNLPTLFLLIFITIYKFVFSFIFLRVFINVYNLIELIQLSLSSFFLICGVISIFVGCFAYRHTNLKVIFAYTTVSQLAYVICGFATNNAEVIKYSFLYLFIYCLQLCIIFIILVILQTKHNYIFTTQLFMIKLQNKFYYYTLFVIVASLAGFPPLSGFIIKYLLFIQMYITGYFSIAICGLISSLLIAIIYLQLLLQIIAPQSTNSFDLYIEQARKLTVLSNYAFLTLLTTLLNIFIAIGTIFTIFFICLLPFITVFLTNLIYAWGFDYLSLTSFNEINAIKSLYDSVFLISSFFNYPFFKDIQNLYKRLSTTTQQTADSAILKAEDTSSTAKKIAAPAPAKGPSTDKPSTAKKIPASPPLKAGPSPTPKKRPVSVRPTKPPTPLKTRIKRWLYFLAGVTVIYYTIKYNAVQTIQTIWNYPHDLPVEVIRQGLEHLNKCNYIKADQVWVGRGILGLGKYAVIWPATFALFKVWYWGLVHKCYLELGAANIPYVDILEVGRFLWVDSHFIYIIFQQHLPVPVLKAAKLAYSFIAPFVPEPYFWQIVSEYFNFPRLGQFWPYRVYTPNNHPISIYNLIAAILHSVDPRYLESISKYTDPTILHLYRYIYILFRLHGVHYLKLNRLFDVYFNELKEHVPISWFWGLVEADIRTYVTNYRMFRYKPYDPEDIISLARFLWVKEDDEEE
jgi:NADH:ubiquinone oxidoreductase subunit 2 (subunit N)